ncbi:MAG: penicillin acylase family protein [Syntrophobacterales bacterium]|nr:penicillin acylase family protein [Syntrophobacterales bacterium]
MREKNFQTLNKASFHWLIWLIILIFPIIIFSGCSDSDPAPRASTVTTTRDAQGVWFIAGAEQDRLYDVFEAMGYAVAQDRLWQGETFRRAARGRLAEIFGAAYVSQDTLVRTTGYSDQELADGFAALGAEEKDVINGYVAGFNRRIAEIRKDPSLLPFEFSAVGMTSATLEDWNYKDVLAWAVLMMRNFDVEAQKSGQIDNAALYQGLVAQYGAATGAKMFEDLRWLDDPSALTYIPNPAKVPLAASQAARTPLMDNPPSSLPDLRAVAASISETREQIDDNLKKINAYVKMGSYAWAIKGTKTATGNPMLYSGPQMGFSVPSIIGEGSIKAGGLNVSGMIITGLPAIVIGRTPHHAWSMQVGHAHTVDYYMEPAAAVTLHRTETIKVAGAADVSLPIYRTSHGPVINAAPPISWKYSHWGYEFKVIKAYLGLARATSMDQFGAAIENVPLSQHYTYVDRDGNIAYWMSGRDPVRPYGGEWRMPQRVGAALEWDSANLIPRSTDRNTSQGYYCGWNNKARAGYPNSWNNASYSFGPFHRAHVVDDYLAANNNLTYDQVKDLALNIATTDSFGGGGNPWKYVSSYFTTAVNAAPDAPVAARTAALALLTAWDGHFVDGGSASWAAGTDRADAWMLMDAWIKEVINLTFEELDANTTIQKAKVNGVLFNTLLHGLRTGGVTNYYNWFQNADGAKPQTANAIIVKALDNVLVTLGAQPWGAAMRGFIPFNHDMLGNVWANKTPFSSRSTYAHVLEYGSAGPLKIKSMFPLGESGDIRVGGGGAPAFDANFFTMTPAYDNFIYRDFPLF